VPVLNIPKREQSWRPLPNTMMAWTKTIDEEGGFHLEEHDVHCPDHGEVLVKTQSTSVCGTDIHIWKWDEWSRDNVPLGTVTGHETAGIVVAVGDGVCPCPLSAILWLLSATLPVGTARRCVEGNAHICENGSIFGVHGSTVHLAPIL